jgi:hypothetical protein
MTPIDLGVAIFASRGFFRENPRNGKISQTVLMACSYGLAMGDGRGPGLR